MSLLHLSLHVSCNQCVGRLYSVTQEGTSLPLKCNQARALKLPAGLLLLRALTVADAAAPYPRHAQATSRAAPSAGAHGHWCGCCLRVSLP